MRASSILLIIVIAFMALYALTDGFRILTE